MELVDYYTKLFEIQATMELTVENMEESIAILAAQKAAIWERLSDEEQDRAMDILAKRRA